VREVLLFEKNDIEYYKHGEYITLSEPSRDEIEDKKRIANSKIEILEYSVRLGNCLRWILGGKKNLEECRVGKLVTLFIFEPERFASCSGLGRKTWNELSELIEETGLISRWEISDYELLYKQYRKELWILCSGHRLNNQTYEMYKCNRIIKKGSSPIITDDYFFQPKPEIYKTGTCDSCKRWLDQHKSDGQI
jgi:hypothetical protein